MNQNIRPLILTETVNVQSGETSDYVDIYASLGPREQMNVFGIYCEIADGGSGIGDINGDNVEESTFTDIVDVNTPFRDDDFTALPMCCNPRTGMGECLDLFLYRSDHALLRGNYIPLALFNNRTPELWGNPVDEIDCISHTAKILLFHEPLTLYPSEKFRIKVRNNNLAVADTDTYSSVKVSFLAEVVDKVATLKLITGASVIVEGEAVDVEQPAT